MNTGQYRQILHQAKAYLNYFAFSRHKRGFGIHSPFVYKLVTEVFIPARRHKSKWITELRKKAFRNVEKTISQAPGAGNHIAAKNMIKAGKLVKRSTIPAKHQQLLVGLFEFVQAEKILELGTCCGLTSAIIARKTPNSMVYTIEGAKNRHEIAKAFFEAENITNIVPVCSDFDASIEQFKQENLQFDAVFVDGNHQYESTIHYFTRLLPIMKEKGVIIFDDIYWSAGMTKAWKEIQQSDASIVTVDIYKMGFVFLGRKQAKEHFCIKY